VAEEVYGYAGLLEREEHPAEFIIYEIYRSVWKEVNAYYS